MLLDRKLRFYCTHFLGHKPKTHREWLQRLGASPWLEHEVDAYGKGPLLELLESRVADLLGKPKAIFFHKAVAGQQMALKTWCAQAGSKNFVLHPQSHFQLDESLAYQYIAGLNGILLGQANMPFSEKDLRSVTDPVGAVAVELPLREAGFKLTPWKTLEKIRAWARDRGAYFHLDGARLWESTHYYGKSLKEIASVADSVYVSFYKGLGGMGGCAIAGPAAFVDDLSVWRSRMGGDLYTAFPYVVTALDALEQSLPKINGYVERAQELASAIAKIDGIRVSPMPPHTNEFQIFLPGTPDSIAKAYSDLIRQHKTWIFGGLEPTAVPGLSMAEVNVSDCAKEVSTESVVRQLEQLLFSLGC